MLKKSILITLIIISLFTFVACSKRTQTLIAENRLAELLVGKDYSSEIIYDEKMGVAKGDTVFGLLGRNLKVETQYGGGFIKSIEGLPSGRINGQQYDWFYYINGIASNCSSKSYKMNDTDKVFWDYHGWTGTTFIPAIIGAYPEPFVNGFKQKNKGATILYAQDSKGEAEKLAQALKDKEASNIEVRDISKDLVINRSKPTIVVGKWKELEVYQEIKEICSRNVEVGIFAKFSNSNFELLNYKGETIKTCGEDAAAIVATGSGLGDSNPLWIITAIRPSEIEEAVNLLEKSPERIRGFYGAVIANGEVIKLPAVK